MIAWIPVIITLVKKGMECFEKLLECNRIHSPWPRMESSEMKEIFEDEEGDEKVFIDKLEYTDGSNVVVKIFNQKCVVCLERDTGYIFEQCGHLCICEEDIQNR